VKYHTVVFAILVLKTVVIDYGRVHIKRWEDSIERLKG
jgi:hypothetical protein